MHKFKKRNKVGNADKKTNKELSEVPWKDFLGKGKQFWTDLRIVFVNKCIRSWIKDTRNVKKHSIQK